jgi:hypothetical protein
MQVSVGSLSQFVEVALDAYRIRQPIVIDRLREDDLRRVVVPIRITLPKFSGEILSPGLRSHVVYDGVVRGDLDILEKFEFIQTHMITQWCPRG